MCKKRGLDFARPNSRGGRAVVRLRSPTAEAKLLAQHTVPERSRGVVRLRSPTLGRLRSLTFEGQKKRGFRPSSFRSMLLLQFYGFPFVKVDALQCVRDRGVVLRAGYSD